MSGLVGRVASVARKEAQEGRTGTMAGDSLRNQTLVIR
jgi:hypothetical protein